MKRKSTKKTLNLYTGSIEDLKFKPILFIDFEYITTSYRENGYRKHIQEIIEVAGIFIDCTGFRKFTHMIKPDLFFKHTNKTNLTKFTQDELHNGIDFNRFISILKNNYTHGKTKIISWGGSDLYNFNYLCNIYKADFFIRKNDYVDLSQKFRRFYNLTQAVTMEKALSYVGINEKFNKHRALPDTEMLFRLFEKMVDDGYLDEELITEV